MSRNAAVSPSASRQNAQLGPHLRQRSRASLDTSSIDVPRSPDTVSSNSTVRNARASRGVSERQRAVTINDSVIGDEVLLNLELLGGSVKAGTLMSIVAQNGDQDRTASSAFGGGAAAKSATSHKFYQTSEDAGRPSGNHGKRYIFVAKDLPRDVRIKNPNIEVYVAKHVGEVFGIKKGTNVVLAPVDEHAPATEASHVELSFKDMYLSRSDMWRLAVSELVDRTVYQGQVIYFMGSIKATVSTVFVDGRKTQSAFFTRDTRPIFRSECARYVLFIQMAREMWDFDSDGSGEIMFYKVVNGFLPALFKKWAMLQVKHLVSIVLFARVEYDMGITTDLAGTTLQNDYFTGFQASGDRRPYKDFYRVVVSEMSSGEWTTILHQLKKEFNKFRRDISVHHLDAMDQALNIPEDPDSKSSKSSRVRTEPSLAMYGNLLEAINLASSQYAQDYIDRDLLRTGISVVVISPGNGVFEVEYENLRRTTEALIGNGIGIDIICIPKIPLHSVPLFRYRNPHYLLLNQRSRPRSLRSRDGTPKQPTPIVGSLTTLAESLSPTKPGDGYSRSESLSRLYTDEWAFALPQWLHVSYWTGKSEEALSYHGISLSASCSNSRQAQEEFTIRCRLYDLQMRGLVETNEIETPPLYADPKFPNVSSLSDDSKQPSVGGSGEQLGSMSPRRPTEAVFDHVYGFQRFSVEKITKPGEESLWKRLLAFDESRSRLPSSRNALIHPRSTRDLDEVARKQLSEDSALFGSSVGDNKPHAIPAELSASFSSMIRFNSDSFKDTGASRRNSTATDSIPRLSTKTPRFMRQISLGQKGFGVAAPKAATAELKMDHASGMHTRQNVAQKAKAMALTAIKGQSDPASPRLVPSDTANRPIEQSRTELSDQLQELMQNTPSRPISIRPPMADADLVTQLKAGSVVAEASMLVASNKHHRSDEDHDVKFSNVLRAEDAQKVYNSKLLAGAMPELPNTLSPTTAMAPWLVVLNPSNPDVNKVDDALLFSRWQHVFPRPSEMRVMKWKSLSSPASVPLTTEHFPTRSQLDSEYTRQPYNIAQDLDDDLGEEPKKRGEFLRELVSARFSHGFQVVIGPSVARAFGQKLIKIADIFSRSSTFEDGTSLFMSIGNTIHQLSCVNDSEVEVNIFVRKPTEASAPLEQPSSLYKPAIRTVLDAFYEDQEIDIVTPKPEKNWNYIDSYLAGHTDEMTENMRFWRARFVLIPINDRHLSVSKLQGDDNDEEVRLEGLKRLAQTWQRHRFLSPSERQFQSTGRRGIRDPNPLDIVYKTEDPSVVIAAELETLPLFENSEATSRKGQLISSRERFSKKNFNLAALTESMKQPIESGGIRMQNRRWHLRLHYNCFIGSDMTTWLIENFEDLESRDEAVEFGNSLMVWDDNKAKEKEKDIAKDSKKDRDRGIFVHVEGRHTFRDGQYFYQIASEIAKPPQTPGWLSIRKREQSVPSTPVSEHNARDLQRPAIGGLPRPTSIHEESSPVSGATTPTMPMSSGRRPKVVLSKVMKYDVDPRKKSYRPERINLHYDRLHNPDNCYHIRIDWMNATAKLIEDTIKTWATTAAQYGLRLVEAPIAEACAIRDANPFRQPYHVKLALAPPTRRPETYFEPNSFTPQSQPGRHYYQKAILRRFDFVLDTEAASSFPSNVDVSYSWGKPDFKYTQYIHRSGMSLAQITDEGDFLLLANRLYTNRAAASQQTIPTRAEAPTTDRVSRLMGPGSHASYGTTEPNVASPLFRPVLFAPLRNAAPDMSPGAGLTAGAGRGNLNLSPNAKPELVKDEMVSFCGDAEKLEAFYKETLEKTLLASTPRATPALGGMAGHHHAVPDSGIPSLGLGPGILGGSEFAGSPRVGTPLPPSNLLLRRGSVQPS